MKKHSRFTRGWAVRRYVGSLFQLAAWRLCDPHDVWMIEYRNENDNACCMAHTGFCSTARVRAREMGGKIVGCNVTTNDWDNQEFAYRPRYPSIFLRNRGDVRDAKARDAKGAK